MKVKRFKTISEFYRFRELPAPQHPLIGVTDVGNVKYLHPDEPMGRYSNFMVLPLKGHPISRYNMASSHLTLMRVSKHC